MQAQWEPTVQVTSVNEGQLEWLLNIEEPYKSFKQLQARDRCR